MRFIKPEFLKFVGVGSFNTLFGYVLYRIFLVALPYSDAYSAAFACGIFISYMLNSWLVFRQPLHWKKALQYPVVYLTQYLLGMVFLYILVEQLHVDQRFAPLLIVIMSLPLTFILSKIIIKGRPAPI